MRYSDHIIEEVKLRSSLSELVSERTEVKSSGRSFTACCPFHSEKTPSFHINEEQGLYYCFGCGKKGNTFTFVMETRGLTFPESVRFLAQRAGVNLPVQSEFKNENDKGVAKKKALLRRLVVEAQNLFEDILWDRRGSRKEGIVAREMLKERYISEQSVKRFRLGFSGSDQGLLLDELYKSIKDSLSITKEDVSQGLLELGLLREYDSGQKREFFRERVMFPISRSDGSPLAFGGRTIFTKPEIPKYINSPESSVYEKRRSFFGLSQGFASAQKARHVFIVEGYTDVISFSQVGLENTLAVCGTALTEDHARILSRFVNRVTLLFDGDSAGRLAAARAFPIFLNSGIEITPVFLPEGEDPDSLAKQVSLGTMDRSDFDSLIESKDGSLLELYLETQAADLRGLPRGSLCSLSELNPSEVGKLGDKVAQSLAVIKNPIEREVRVKEACDLLGVSSQAIKELMRQKVVAKNGVSGIANGFNRPNALSPIKHVTQISETSIEISAIEEPSLQQNSALLERRMKELRRQLTLAVLVDPSILKNISIMDQAKEAAKDDLRLETLFSVLSSGKGSFPMGLSIIVTGDKTEATEVMASIHGILTRCDLQNEGLMEEAIKQLTMGGAEYDKFIAGLSDDVKRVRLFDQMDVLRIQESKELDADGRLRLAQEKLLRKRSLSQMKAKEV